MRIALLALLLVLPLAACSTAKSPAPDEVQQEQRQDREAREKAAGEDSSGTMERREIESPGSDAADDEALDY